MSILNQRNRSRSPLLAAVAGVAAWALLCAEVRLEAQGLRPGEHWVGTWAAAATSRIDSAPQPQPAAQPAQPQRQVSNAPGHPLHAGPLPVGAQAPLHFKNQTLRQIAHVSIGGDRLRVVLTNVFGAAPLRIGAASVALREKDATIVAGSSRPLTFSGSRLTTIAPGAVLVSDPVNLNVPALADLAIDIYLPDDTAAMKSPITTHAAAWQTSFVSSAGNHVGAANLPVQTTTGYRRTDGAPTGTWFFLSRVEVVAPQQTGVVVTLGDSITDGTHSGLDANNRWPDHLARRLAQEKIRMGVLNMGIGGNRVLIDGNGVSALARFDRDVLSHPGVTHLIVMEGINDIGNARENSDPSAADLIAAYRQIVERAHAHGIKVIAGTLTPYEGANYYTPQGEAKRKALNEWFKTSGIFDGVADFDAATRDPARPTKFLPKFDSGDNLHPNATGYEAMANAIDLSLFKSH